MTITLATLAFATAQQVFEQVRDHMLRQGRQSTLNGEAKGTCAYRGIDGLQCAAGCLIADDEYEATMEGAGWGSPIFPDAHRELIRAMQAVHDHKPADLWEPSLRTLGKRFGLAWTVTLATLPTASAQEVYEQAAEHLLKQNDRSLDDRGIGCAYRGRGGLACAAGALMSDADASTLTPSQNGTSWHSLVGYGVVPAVHMRLISDLQCIHDNFYPGDWRERLRLLATAHGLDSSFMDLLPVPYVAVSSRETALT